MGRCEARGVWSLDAALGMSNRTAMVMNANVAILLVAVMMALDGLPLVTAATDNTDVEALHILYSSLNKPRQLSGWKPSGGDPCGESWKGVSCSGTAVVSIQIPGLQLKGTLGYMLSNFLSLKILDVSNNYIHDAIPYQLPPNLTHMNLGGNNFSGNLPYSFSVMISLNYLNVSRNSLSQSVGDFFANLRDLSVLDISFNSLSGVLPHSFGSLSKLSSLYVQNNQLSGEINMISNLSLNKLNIANNHFSGRIPPTIRSIPDLRIEGNSFDYSQVPAPAPAPCQPLKNKSKYRRSSIVGPIIGIVLGSLCISLGAALVVIFCLRSNKRGKGDLKKFSKNSPSSLAHGKDKALNKEVQEVKIGISMASPSTLPPEERAADKTQDRNAQVKRKKVPPINATFYTVATLQNATNSFSQECLVGEGSLGRVYLAEFSNGKAFAVKTLESAAAHTVQEEESFLEAVSNISRLQHSSIVPLLGYCLEHGQRLLVHEFIRNGTLQEILHYADDGGRAFSWNARMKVALGTARALEYLHEVCGPPVVHKNVKSANILLDEELNPYLSDCGLASLIPTPRVCDVRIYTVKSDVYSFGVVMLELLTGRKPLDSSKARLEQSLVRWAAPQLHDIDLLAKMVDPVLNGMYPAKSLSRFADVIALCVQAEPEFRPPMSEVAQSLIRLVQRTSLSKRRSGDEFGFTYKTPERDAPADATF
ncbi:unnamed protein product [Spirodela intermedia]|uniref:Protein kinase domain-containing protein n=1 Tax=Spirodela intermedia TaxID=51605 RepID=A0A7I8IWM8_SPIIN|nr:unnamed protein product [Spirodela intermedia]CAA6661410.1 unnamed protein product [Spirodela intermedia]